MKKLFIFIVLVPYLSIVTAQAGNSSCCKKGKAGKTVACDKKCAKGMEAAQMDAAGLEKTETPCPNKAAGEKCNNPERCAKSSDAENADPKTKSQSRSWWHFWGNKAEKDCCKKP